MPRNCFPLRYPGGKQILAPVLNELLTMNGASGGTFIEPFAGGAGAALSLLLSERVNSIIINDADENIAALWRSMLDDTDVFVGMVQTTTLDVTEWTVQREIYRNPAASTMLERGFATFYLNRCNRSGIIATGGPIGGIAQEGAWKIDARFNRADLISRIRRIASYRSRITVRSCDALDFLKEVATLPPSAKSFCYLDPPYFVKAEDLYMNTYDAADHARLAKRVKSDLKAPWVMTYDNVPPIRRLYESFRTIPFGLAYSARERSRGKEVLIARRSLKIPPRWQTRIPASALHSRIAF